MKRTCSLNKIVRNGDSGIIYNGLTGGIMHASASLLRAYDLALAHQPLDQEIIEALFPDAEVRRSLEREYVLVPLGFDEIGFVEKARQLTVEQDLSTNVEFIVTYRCNFRCTYCYAGQARPHMNDDMALRAANFAADLAGERDSKAMMVQFIGGEPLLNPRAIETVCRRMQAFRDERGLIMSTSLTTNGSLLTRSILRRIRALGPIQVQITLDGPEPIHNRRRPMKNGNSFESIVKNINEYGSDMDELVLRINVDYENVQALPEFLDRMREHVPEHTSLTMVPTFAHTEASSHYTGQCFSQCDLPPQLERIWSKALDCGYPPAWNPIPTFASCGAVMPGSIAVDPLGDIYKCAAAYGDRTLTVGNVYEGLNTSKGSVYDQYVNRDRRVLASGQCAGCTAQAVCMGGCSFRSLRRTGVMHEKDCRYDHNECLDDFVRLYFDSQTRAE